MDKIEVGSIAPRWIQKLNGENYLCVGKVQSATYYITERKTYRSETYLPSHCILADSETEAEAKEICEKSLQNFILNLKGEGK